jgi:signal transduction histidine kinase
MRAQSLRMELGRPFAIPHIVLVLAACTLVFEFLLWCIGLYVPRAMFATSSYAVGAALIALHASQIARAEESKLARWIALAYVLVFLAMLVRVIYLSQQDFSRVHGNVVTDGAASVAVAVAMLLSSVIGHFGYLGLYLERSLKQSVLQADEQARFEMSQQLGAQIAVLERRQSLGEMAASIGHELNQPLTAILTNAQLVKRGLQTGRLTTDAALPFLEKIEYNTQRASGILERIRSFMRTGTVHRDQVNLHEVVNSVLQLMEADLASHSVGIELSAMDMPLYVSGDALELSQVMLNLMKNAVESMSGTSERSIQIGLDMVDGNARIRVRDSGPGLNEEQNAKAGTPFFTTKQQGLGMGLAISRSIVRKHGGALTLTNADDGGCSGALAMVALPMAQEVK